MTLATVWAVEQITGDCYRASNEANAGVHCRRWSKRLFRRMLCGVYGWLHMSHGLNRIRIRTKIWLLRASIYVNRGSFSLWLDNPLVLSYNDDRNRAICYAVHKSGRSGTTKLHSRGVLVKWWSWISCQEAMSDRAFWRVCTVHPNLARLE